MKTNLEENIDKLIKGTNTGKIYWTKATENTFYWQTMDGNSKMNVVVQGTKNPVNQQVKDVLFRLYDVENKTALINVETQDTPQYRDKIFDLFNIVKESYDVGRVDILSNLLKDID